MTNEEIKDEFINCIEGSHTLNLAISILEDREELQRENQLLKERINKIDKHVSSLSSTGRGCEIYEDVKREILKVVRGDSK